MKVILLSKKEEDNFGQKVPAVSKHLQIFGYKNLLESFLTLENSSTNYATSGVIFKKKKSIL